jgi:threonine/homoserine/homoserine lactone efflux protein
MLAYWVKGVLIGFSIAAPVGPIGMLCIRRTLSDGRWTGLFSGLGAATADALYGCVAGFGLTFVSSFLLRQQTFLRGLGGAFLCYLGVRTLLAVPADKAARAGGMGLLGAYLSTLLLTIANPMTIFSFVGVFTGLGMAASGGDYHYAAVLVLGVFTGSALWWLLLSGAVALARERLTLAALRWVNRLSGLIILAFGLVALASALL